MKGLSFRFGLQVRYVLENCKEDLAFFVERQRKGLPKEEKNVVERLTVCFPFARHFRYQQGSARTLFRPICVAPLRFIFAA
jgi:DNA-binding XRE family transcriptional regulator